MSDLDVAVRKYATPVLKWRKSTGIPQTYLAKEMNWSQPKAHRIETGKVPITLSDALKIEEITKGAVSVYDWS